MIRRPPRSTLSSSSAASDVYKRQYILRVITLRQVRLWVKRIDAHLAHKPAYPFAVDDHSIEVAQKCRDCPVSPCRLIRMDAVNLMHKLHRFIRDPFEGSGINAGSSNLQQRRLFG